MAKPSAIMQAVISGKISPQDAPKPIQSVLRLHWYREAKRLLQLPIRKRKAEFEKLPPGVQPLVKAEALRITQKKAP